VELPHLCTTATKSICLLGCFSVPQGAERISLPYLMISKSVDFRPEMSGRITSLLGSRFFFAEGGRNDQEKWSEINKINNFAVLSIKNNFHFIFWSG
jgi:hypothetical protein